MIEERAVITSVSDGLAKLELERQTACGLCGQKRGCGNATWGKLLGHNNHEFTAENPINAKAGESVVIGIDERAVLNTVFFLYVVPLLAMTIATIVCHQLFHNEFYVMVGALVGLVLGFVAVKVYLIGRDQNGKAYSKQYKAVILHRCQNGDDENSAKVNDIYEFQTKRGE